MTSTPSVRQTMVNGLAVVGALSILSSLAQYGVHHFTDRTATGVVLGADDKPAANAPVFLDRGGVAIERYVTDSTGRFRLPLEQRELRHAVWLICAPGLMPMVDNRMDGQLGATTYQSTQHTAGSISIVRGFGWRGPIPRECPQDVDTMGFRVSTQGGSAAPFSKVEPTWPK